MSGFRIEGNQSGNVAEVDNNNNLKVTLPSVLTQAGYEVAVGEVDAGVITGTPMRRATNVTQGRRLNVGIDTPIFDYTFNAAAQDTGIWKFTNSTMTATQSAGSVLFNAAGNAATAGYFAALSTWRNFALLGGAPLRISTSVQITAIPLTNQIFEVGLFNQAIPIADGVYFRFSSAGLLGVINYNGTETTTSVLISGSTFPVNTAVDLVIITGEGSTEFYADQNNGNGLTLLGIIQTPASQSEPFMYAALPLSLQQRNGSTVSGSPQMQVKWTDANVVQKSLALELPYANQMVLQKGSHQGLSGGAMGPLALYTNNLAPGAGAAMTNTAASLGTGLGGQFATNPTLTTNTDGIVCSYQNPTGSINQTPRTLVITGIHISSMVTTALTGGPVQYFYSLAFGHNAVSLANTEQTSFTGAGSKAPRRLALGCETFASAAAVGVVGTSGGIHIPLYSPVVVNPGEFVAVAAKNVGSVTSAGVITFLVTFDHYWI